MDEKSRYIIMMNTLKRSDKKASEHHMSNILKELDGVCYEDYLRASEDGDYFASTVCGIVCEEGKGVPVDYARARYFYDKAIEKSRYVGKPEDPEVSFRLGRLLFYGLGVKEDIDEEERENERQKGMYLMRIYIYSIDWSVINIGNVVRELEKRQQAMMNEDEEEDLLD